MKQKVAFALLMGLITTGIISSVLISLNLGWPHHHAAVWLRTWLIAYLIVVPAILVISPLIQKLVTILIPNK